MSDFLPDMGEYLGALLNAILYPFIMLIDMVGSLIDQILDPVRSLIDGVYGMFYAIYSFLDSLLSFFPPDWRILILATFGFGIALWAYNLLTRIT